MKKLRQPRPTINTGFTAASALSVTRDTVKTPWQAYMEHSHSDPKSSSKNIYKGDVTSTHIATVQATVEYNPSKQTQRIQQHTHTTIRHHAARPARSQGRRWGLCDGSARPLGPREGVREAVEGGGQRAAGPGWAQPLWDPQWKPAQTVGRVLI